MGMRRSRRAFQMFETSRKCQNTSLIGPAYLADGRLYGACSLSTPGGSKSSFASTRYTRKPIANDNSTEHHQLSPRKPTVYAPILAIDSTLVRSIFLG